MLCVVHPIPVVDDGIYGQGMLGALQEAMYPIYLCTASDLSALSPRYFSPDVCNRVVTPPEGEGGVQLDPPLQLLPAAL